VSEGQNWHCGPDSWPEWARAFLSQDPAFNNSCLTHDVDYQNMSQKEADEKFYEALKKAIGPVWLNPDRRFAAWMFYKNVRWFGKKAWKSAQKEKKI